jgi:SAM-dependent methyltransferase
METVDLQKMYNQIQEVQDLFNITAANSEQYHHVTILINQLKLYFDQHLDNHKEILYSHSKQMTENLYKQDLELRRKFVQSNRLDQYDVDRFTGLVTANSSFALPTLELFPGTGQLLPAMVHGEPLYLVDRYIEICNEAAAVLNNEYYADRRLRKYAVKDYDLSALPQNAIAVAYCFNEFFYADTDYIRNWCDSIYKVLMPGGRFVFNFMPEDELWAIEACQKLDFSIIDYRALLRYLTNTGWQVETCDKHQFHGSYISIIKPGAIADRLKLTGSSAEIIDIR